jgi:glycosyltransferase involved in cell wall biosynthesis
MKIVYVNPFFTDGMGYIENCLPKTMAKRGHEVHIITSTGKVYFNDPVYKQVYQKFFGPPLEPAGTYLLNGNVKLHRLNFISVLNTPYFKGLKETLDDIKPDVVHAWDVTNPHILQFFYHSRRLGYKMYTGNHYVLSVLQVHKVWDNWFSLLKYKWLFLKVLPGKFLHRYYVRCYAATVDAKLVAEKYMGVPPEKCFITPLGVDTDVFKPEGDKQKIREQKLALGFGDADFILLYTGRFTKGKNPLVLAKAINQLQSQGYKNIKGLFVGSGNQVDEIKSCAGCHVVDFVPYYELYKYYQIADVGVWPAQESTSMLDAAASGVPIIVNDTLYAKERYEGNGLTYKLGSVENMCEQIVRLYNDPDLRVKLGKEGQRKMQELYSWDKIAAEREKDYLEDANRAGVLSSK